MGSNGRQADTKRADLKAYAKENASILFIYNTGKANLRKPKDYNLDTHIQRIESNAKDIRWGMMWRDSVKKFYRECKRGQVFKPISYMGNKSGVVIESKTLNGILESISGKQSRATRSLRIR